MRVCRAVPALGLLFGATGLLLFSMNTVKPAPPSPDPPADPTEVAVRLIALQGEWRNAEFSGLAWYDDDWLIFLPQWPDRFRSDSAATGDVRLDGQLFMVDEDDVEDAADGELAGPLTLHPVALYASGVVSSVAGFQGYEAIAIVGDSAFLAIEAEVEGVMQGYLVAGAFETDDGDPTALRLDPNTLTPIPAPALPRGAINLENMSYEALVATPSTVAALYEANGQIVDPYPRSYIFDHRGRLGRALSFPVLEYRVTDATDLDKHGRFWGINTYWPGDETVLRPAADSLALQYGQGPTHAQSRTVERLVEFRMTGEGIVRTRRAPIQLRLLDRGATRNWEGLVRLDDEGFLMVTDSYPGTMLGFVPFES